MIRRMEEDDINKVMDLWLTATIKAHPFVKENYWLKHYRTVKNKYLKVAKTYVAVEEDCVVGFISVLHDDFIGALFVIPGRQGKGIGSSLLAYVKERYPSLKAHAYVRNKQALHFYKKQGFTTIGRQNNLDSQFEEDVMEWIKEQ